MSRRLSALPIAGIAVPGVVAGHALTYLATIRNAAHRSDVLGGTGHSYWSTAIAVAFVAGLLAAGATALRVIRGSARGETAGSIGSVVARLAPLQAAAYVAIEGLERLIAGGSPADALHHGLLPAGIAIQAAVALAGAVLLHLLARTVRRVVRALRVGARRPSTTASSAPRPAPVLRARASRGAWGLRGPPPRRAFAAGR